MGEEHFIRFISFHPARIVKRMRAGETNETNRCAAA
jgi:hypothetical protein